MGLARETSPILCADLAQKRQVDDPVDSERTDRGAERSSVEDTEVLLGRKGNGPDAVRAEHLA